MQKRSCDGRSGLEVRLYIKMQETDFELSYDL